MIIEIPDNTVLFLKGVSVGLLIESLIITFFIIGLA